MSQASEVLHRIPYGNGHHLAVWEIPAVQANPSKHIFMTHGTFSDKRVCMGIAAWLAEKGYTSWILEWRAHGSSSPSPEPFNFESIARHDLPVVFNYLLEKQDIEELFALTHSGGGIVLSLFLILYPTYQEKISRIAIFGCQAFGAAVSRWNYYKILGGKILGQLSGTVPGRKGGRPHDETYFTMKPWFDWNLSGEFRGLDGEDFKRRMPEMQVPLMSVYAKGDTFIAPPEGCIAFWQAFDNEANSGLYCSRESGYSEDFDHSRVLHSRTAQKEIWPQVLTWFRA